jgi:hypothetical protein
MVKDMTDAALGFAEQETPTTWYHFCSHRYRVARSAVPSILDLSRAIRLRQAPAGMIR